VAILPFFELIDASFEVAVKPVAEKIQAVTVAKLEPIEKPSGMKVIRKMGSSYTPSIRDALSGKTNEDKVQEGEQNSTFSQYDKDLLEPFTQEQLAERWNEFVNRMADRPSLCSALSNVPDLVEGNKLLLTIGNSVQEEDIRLVKPELISWLRKVLRNSGIELTTTIGKVESERMIFSDTEKLQMMIQKNPNLNELKQKFNLDFKD
jgi:hypothetical protein